MGKFYGWNFETVYYEMMVKRYIVKLYVIVTTQTCYYTILYTDDIIA